VHSVTRRADVAPAPAYGAQSDGFARAPLVDAALHMTLDLSVLEAGGRVDCHVHSFEESFYVLDGGPILHLGDHGIRLAPGSGGIMPVGVPHGWTSDGECAASWIEMTSPRRRGDGKPPDTFFVAEPALEAPSPLDVRDPRTRHLFRFAYGQLDVEHSRTRGSSVEDAAVSASMATALLAYSGIAVKMLVDQRLGAQLHTMFMVEYQPGGVAHTHDHPFVEAYYQLEGEIDAAADGQEFVLRPGDTLWTGVGCIHSFRNTTGGLVRWLETTAPQPPASHSYRFNRDWDYLAAELQTAEPPVTTSVQ
jgi:quercetin dioxygenase-like cupin family protein